MERFTDASFHSMSYKWRLLHAFVLLLRHILCLSGHSLASLIHLKVTPEIKPDWLCWISRNVWSPFKSRGIYEDLHRHCKCLVLFTNSQ